MRWSSRTLIYIGLAAVGLATALSSNALAQRGFGGGTSRGSGFASPPSSTALGAGANFGGRAAPPSSTAIGAGAPTRSSIGRGAGYSSGFNNSGYNGSGFNNSGHNGSRGGGGLRGSNGRRGDYRNVPFPYFLTPYYYPFLDYGSAPYGGGPGGAPEDLPYDPGQDPAVVGQNLLGAQVQRLTAELDQMKYAQQQQSPAPAAAEHDAEPPAPVIPVTVVLRNGQKLQVQNYAVMDRTFWDFSKQPARRIPISSIDVSASSEATAANGGEFPQLVVKQ